MVAYDTTFTSGSAGRSPLSGSARDQKIFSWFKCQCPATKHCTDRSTDKACGTEAGEGRAGAGEADADGERAEVEATIIGGGLEDGAKGREPGAR